MWVSGLLLAKRFLGRNAMNLVVMATLAGAGGLMLHEIRTAAALRVEVRQAAQSVEVLRSQNEVLRTRLEGLAARISERSAENDALRTEFSALRREAQAINDACTAHPLGGGLPDLLRRGAERAAGGGDDAELPGNPKRAD